MQLYIFPDAEPMETEQEKTVETEQENTGMSSLHHVPKWLRLFILFKLSKETFLSLASDIYSIVLQN